MTGSGFSSATPQGHKQRVDKGEVTVSQSYKKPEGQDVQIKSKTHQHQLKGKKKISKHFIKMEILILCKMRNDCCDIYVGQMKPQHCRFFLERFSSVICVIALQQLLVTHWRRREGRLRRNTSACDGGGMRVRDNAAKQRTGVGGRVLFPTAGSVFR